MELIYHLSWLIWPYRVWFILIDVSISVCKVGGLNKWTFNQLSSADARTIAEQWATGRIFDTRLFFSYLSEINSLLKFCDILSNNNFSLYNFWGAIVLISFVEVTGDNGFSLSINGDPQTFSPGATYTVRYRVWRYMYYIHSSYLSIIDSSWSIFLQNLFLRLRLFMNERLKYSRLRGDKNQYSQKQFQRFVLTAANTDSARWDLVTERLTGIYCVFKGQLSPDPRGISNCLGTFIQG